MKHRINDLFKSRFRRCSHVHLSGRRCGMQTSPPKSGKVLCVLHKSLGACAECSAMTRAFVPPKGW